MRYYILSKTNGRFAERIPFNGALAFIAAFQRYATKFEESEIDAALAEMNVSRSDVQLMEAK